MVFGQKGTLTEQRRTLGLCFKCGDKYYPDHQCKIKLQMLMGESEELQEEQLTETLITEQLAPSLEDAFVSMHATHHHPNTNTMTFKGELRTTPICALLDSRSTHSFINPLILRGQSCQIQETSPMIVMVANGECMVTDSKCASLNFSLQGHVFQHEMRLLPVKGYDMILGLDWLSKFGPMTIDWRNKWVEIPTEDTVVKLQVQEENAAIQLCEEVELDKEFKPQSEIMVAHIWLCEAEIKQETTPLDPSLHSVLLQFPEVFAQITNSPPSRSIDHRIPLHPNSQPVNLRPYRYSHFQRIELDKIIEELLKNEVIRPSTSLFASPALLVKKKDGC
jgi:Retroviral aspartyl protease